mgnify:CR=1 FL=1
MGFQPYSYKIQSIHLPFASLPSLPPIKKGPWWAGKKPNLRILQKKSAYAIMPLGKRNKCSTRTREKPQSGSSGAFLFLFWEREGLGPQAGYRLLIAIQPFDDVVAGYTSRNSDKERS